MEYGKKVANFDWQMQKILWISSQIQKYFGSVSQVLLHAKTDKNLTSSSSVFSSSISSTDF